MSFKVKLQAVEESLLNVKGLDRLISDVSEETLNDSIDLLKHADSLVSKAEKELNLYVSKIELLREEIFRNKYLVSQEIKKRHLTI